MHLLLSSSPGPNKSSCFQREPPEGCEKVRVWEETRCVCVCVRCTCMLAAFLPITCLRWCGLKRYTFSAVRHFELHTSIFLRMGSRAKRKGSTPEEFIRVGFTGTGGWWISFRALCLQPQKAHVHTVSAVLGGGGPQRIHGLFCLMNQLLLL